MLCRLLTSCGFTPSTQINYFRMIPADRDMADQYSKYHKNRLNALIKPWLIIALLICLASAGLAPFGVGEALFVSLRALVDVFTAIIWWALSKRTANACLLVLPLNYFCHFLGVTLMHVAL